eukprot:gnl/Hemi2/5798_TR2002_c0_g1_i1.p1 gnl/Hemi2/5798_TR2002_c0_g1~~gnl/Hemi2/5798_TR2002_c0_g1_i1.p1  ORF type:complete len:344 (+),score=100.25 gnl/Hemi2/5798_TR2002_c0_g1_i1:30-1034(+)
MASPGATRRSNSIATVSPSSAKASSTSPSKLPSTGSHAKLTSAGSGSKLTSNSTSSSSIPHAPSPLSRGSSSNLSSSPSGSSSSLSSSPRATALHSSSVSSISPSLSRGNSVTLSSSPSSSPAPVMATGSKSNLAPPPSTSPLAGEGRSRSVSAVNASTSSPTLTRSPSTGNTAAAGLAPPATSTRSGSGSFSAPQHTTLLTRVASVSGTSPVGELHQAREDGKEFRVVLHEVSTSFPSERQDDTVIEEYECSLEEIQTSLHLKLATDASCKLRPSLRPELASFHYAPLWASKRIDVGMNKTFDEEGKGICKFMHTSYIIITPLAAEAAASKPK